MSLKKTTKRGHSSMSELNITPLLDLVFVLLVIFIITTPQLMNNLEMTLPSPNPPPPPKDKPKITKIEVDAGSHITVDGETVTVEQFTNRLAELKASNPDPEVVVKGDDETEYQGMVVVLDQLRRFDITKIGLATQ